VKSIRPRPVRPVAVPWRGLEARPVEHLDDDTLRDIASSEVSPEHAALEDIFGEAEDSGPDRAAIAAAALANLRRNIRKGNCE
jgi:hypothetical protein